MTALSMDLPAPEPVFIDRRIFAVYPALKIDSRFLGWRLTNNHNSNANEQFA